MLGGDEALPELASLLNDADPQVQRESIRAIVQIGTPKAYAVLERAVASDRRNAKAWSALGRALHEVAQLLGEGPGGQGRAQRLRAVDHVHRVGPLEVAVRDLQATDHGVPRLSWHRPLAGDDQRGDRPRDQHGE